MSIRNRLAHNPIYIWLSHASYRLGTLISPDWTSRRRFQKTFGFALREDAPVWWSEKLMLLKMRDYNRSPLVRQCANKYAVRDYVRKCGCGELLLETYGVWDNANDIPFDELPPDCILKTTMGCGLQNHVIIRNGQLPDHAAAVRTLQSALHDRYYLDYAEMQYAPGSDYKPQIYCERLVSSPAGAMPPDYKVYCFHGEPHYVLYCYNRSTHDGHAEFMLLNANGQPQPALFPSNAENATPPRSAYLEKMFHYARILSKPFPFVRVDFYMENDRPLIGEMTFTPKACLNINMTELGQVELGRLL